MEQQDLQWDPMPSYLDFFRGVVDVYTFLGQDVNATASFESNWKFFSQNGIGLSGLALLLFLAVAFTIMRHQLTKYLFKPFGRYFDIPLKSEDKLHESIWRLMFYFYSWILEFYLAVMKYRYFQKPNAVFLNQDQKTDIPGDIEVLYTVQMGYYMHGFYCIFFLDIWKKDSAIMAIHHISVMLLLIFSYTMKCTEIGLLILLLHDCSDILLELFKVFNYLKVQSKKTIRVLDHTATATFALLVLSWFVCRLYLYPLKAIHTMSHNAAPLNLYSLQFSYSCYNLSLLILLMNAYWAMLLVQLIVKVLTGNMSELDDLRDYDVETNIKDNSGNTGRKKNK